MTKVVNGSPRAPANARRTAVVRLAVYASPPALILLSVSIVAAQAAVVRKDLALSATGLGALIGAIYLASGLVMPWAGSFVDRHGPTACTMVGLVAAGVGAIVYGGAERLATAAGGAALLGLANAFMMPSFGRVAAHELSSARFPLAMALLSFTLGAFVVLGGLIGSAIDGDGAWRWGMWMLVGIAPVLAALTWWIRAPALDRDQVPQAAPRTLATAEPAGYLLANRTVRVACFAGFVLGGILISFGALWNEFMARAVWRLDPGEREIVVTAFRVASMVGSPSLALLALSTGPVPLLRWSTGIVVVAISIWALSPVRLDLAGALLVVVMLGVGASALPIAVATAVQSMPLRRAGGCVGLVQASGMLGSFTLMWLPSMLALVPDLSVAGRGAVGGATVAAVAAFAHVLTWGLRPTLPARAPR